MAVSTALRDRPTLGWAYPLVWISKARLFAKDDAAELLQKELGAKNYDQS